MHGLTRVKLIKKRKEKYDNIHFATQASREQARLRRCYQPTAVTVWVQTGLSVPALSRHSSSDDRGKITKQTGQPSTTFSKMALTFSSAISLSHRYGPTPHPHIQSCLFSTTPPKVLNAHTNKNENLKTYVNCHAPGRKSWKCNK